MCERERVCVRARARVKERERHDLSRLLMDPLTMNRCEKVRECACVRARARACKREQEREKTTARECACVRVCVRERETGRGNFSSDAGGFVDDELV